MEASNTRQTLVSILRSLGYTTLELLLTPLQYGIPNSRLRYYLLAKLHPMTFPHTLHGPSDDIWRNIPGQPNWTDHGFHSASSHGVIPTSNSSVCRVEEYLDYNQGASSHAIPDKVLLKYGKLFDIVLPSSRRTCCFTRGWLVLLYCITRSRLLDRLHTAR